MVYHGHQPKGDGCADGVGYNAVGAESSSLLIPLLSLEMLQEEVSWKTMWELCFTSPGKSYHLP